MTSAEIGIEFRCKCTLVSRAWTSDMVQLLRDGCKYGGNVGLPAGCNGRVVASQVREEGAATFNIPRGTSAQGCTCFGVAASSALAGSQQ